MEILARGVLGVGEESPAGLAFPMGFRSLCLRCRGVVSVAFQCLSRGFWGLSLGTWFRLLWWGDGHL